MSKNTLRLYVTCAITCILLSVSLISCVQASVVLEDTVQLTEGINQQSPTWSPDGDMIAYSSDQAIWIMDGDGSNQRRIYDSMVWDGEPCFDVDGSRIYFASENVGPFSSKFISIHVIDLDGTNRSQLTENADKRAPAVSPDGSSIVYLSKVSGNYDVWIMDTDGSASEVITDAQADESSPSWSPDGSQIVYSLEGDIWIVGVDGLQPMKLTDDPFINDEPAFSPNGYLIAFMSNRDNNSDIWIMNADGTGSLQLTTDISVQMSPSWNPDGKRIAYVSNKNDEYNIWVMRLNDTDSPIDVTTQDETVEDSSLIGTDNGLIGYALENPIKTIAGILISTIVLVYFLVKRFVRGI
ncbi:MAG: LpqB family beta-propeller domain-containing protein [Euryarchaeota archaeon]|nr:LpqB family beta-propeller domain-containing protein [Euryarchaeota archaeon]